MKIALALVLALVACGGDNKPATPDGNPGTPDAPPDGPVVQATFTSYTIDLVLHQTSNTTAPRPFGEFASLPDPDTNNAAAYGSLF